MSRLQTLRMIACMLLMGVVAIAAYLFYQHSLYFCLFFSLMIMAGIIIYICQWQYKTTRMISRMIEGIRYADFSLSFSTQHKTRTEQRLAQEINNVVAEFRTRLSENEERYQYYETLLNTVDSSLLVVDSQCNIHWMNRAAMQDLCGYRIHSVRELALLNSDFPTIILSLQPGEIKTVRIHKGDIIQELAVTVSEYSAQHGTELRLVNLKNIHAVLEENEMEAWQKLIRVLTHEIMNTIAPIISLSQTLSTYPDINEKAVRGLRIIQAQSERLLQFTESFRHLSYLPKPEKKLFSLTATLQNLRELLSGDFKESNIIFTLTCEPKTIYMKGDENQLSQVLLNLLKNSMQALEGKEKGRISIHAQQDEHISIDIADNGPGIPPELQEKIFIPFFTTKSEGSGIGLSLCKQIIRLHDGHLTIQESNPGKTIFHIDMPL